MRAAALPKLVGTGRRTDRHRQEYTHTNVCVDGWTDTQTHRETDSKALGFVHDCQQFYQFVHRKDPLS